jgi:hypothetical protein
MNDLEKYKSALRKMARDYIESLHEEANWG